MRKVALEKGKWRLLRNVKPWPWQRLAWKVLRWAYGGGGATLERRAGECYWLRLSASGTPSRSAPFMNEIAAPIYSRLQWVRSFFLQYYFYGSECKLVAGVHPIPNLNINLYEFFRPEIIPFFLSLFVRWIMILFYAVVLLAVLSISSWS